MQGTYDFRPGFFLLAADKPVAAKPDKHPQRVQPLVLVKLNVMRWSDKAGHKTRVRASSKVGD